MIESTGKVATIQANCMLSGTGIPVNHSMWVAQVYWVCHALNFTATKTSPECKSLYEMWYVFIPPRAFVSLPETKVCEDETP